MATFAENAHSNDNDQFFLDRELIRNSGMDADEVSRFIAGVAETAPEVQRALTAEDLRTGAFFEGAEAKILRGWNSKISGDVLYGDIPTKM